MNKEDMLTDQEFRAALQKKIESLGGVRAASRTLGISASYLCQASKGTRPIGPRILNAMQAIPVSMYILLEKKD